LTVRECAHDAGAPPDLAQDALDERGWLTQKRPAMIDLRVQERLNRTFYELRLQLIEPLQDIEPFVEIVDRCGFL